MMNKWLYIDSIQLIYDHFDIYSAVEQKDPDLLRYLVYDHGIDFDEKSKDGKSLLKTVQEMPDEHLRLEIMSMLLSTPPTDGLMSEGESHTNEDCVVFPSILVFISMIRTISQLKQAIKPRIAKQ